jgi:hypothetical protein
MKKIQLGKRDQQLEAIEVLKRDPVEGSKKVLEFLAYAVLEKEPLKQEFQNIVNAVVVQSMLTGQLQIQSKRGRPSGENEEKELEACKLFWQLIDSGRTSTDAVLKVASHFYKDERQIRRYLEKHKDRFATTREERQRSNESIAFVHYWFKERELPNHYQEVVDRHKEQLLQRDLHAELDQIIAEQIAKATDTK